MSTRPVFETDSLYVNVILPLPLALLFTYSVPDEFAMHVAPGKRVTVQFGKQKIYSAVIRTVHHQPPSGYEAKPILQVLDENRVVNDFQFQLWDWMAGYYLCSVGEVMQASLPSVLKLQSESKISFNPAFDRMLTSRS